MSSSISQIITQSARPRLSFQQRFISSICMRIDEGPDGSRRSSTLWLPPNNSSERSLEPSSKNHDSIHQRLVVPKKERNHSFLVLTDSVEINVHGYSISTRGSIADRKSTR